MLLIGLPVSASRLAAQDLECHGQNFGPPPEELEFGIDLARAGGSWRAVHGRAGAAGVNAATSISQRGDTLTVVFNDLKKIYQGVFDRSAGIVRGGWLQGGTTTRLNARCWVIAPEPDASPHKTLSVAVEKGVQLEVLDWGGSGRPVVLVPGLAASAHEFDSFAPKLAVGYHVYAITRRGEGRSSHPDSSYTPNRLGDDVVAVLDSLHVEHPVLIGHSFGGAQLSNVGVRYPKRVAGLVYLDAGYGPAYIDSTRDTLDVSPDTSIHCPCSVHELLDRNEYHVHHIPVPVLSIFSVQADWNTRAFDSRQPDWTPAKQSAEFARGVPTARVVNMPNATHVVFQSNEAEVVREIRAFISALPP